MSDEELMMDSIRKYKAEQPPPPARVPNRIISAETQLCVRCHKLPKAVGSVHSCMPCLEGVRAARRKITGYKGKKTGRPAIQF